MQKQKDAEALEEKKKNEDATRIKNYNLNGGATIKKYVGSGMQ